MTHQNMPQEAPDKQAEIEHTLDDYERELLQAIEEGQLAPTPGLIPDKTLLEAAARKTLELTRRQLDAGAVNVLALLSAQQSYQQTRIARVQAQAARLTDTAALYQALGGASRLTP